MTFVASTLEGHNGKGGSGISPVSYALNAKRGYRDGDADTNYVASAASVRRLTPTECERLQALPDGWTDLGGTPDSRRYAGLGDAVTASVGEWIGRRIIGAAP